MGGSLVAQGRGRAQSLTVESVVRVVLSCGRQGVQGDGGMSRGQVDLTIGVVAGQPQAGGSPEGEGAGQGGWTALVGEMHVTGSGTRGGDGGAGGEQLTVHSSRQGGVRAEVSQELV